MNLNEQLLHFEMFLVKCGFKDDRRSLFTVRNKKGKKAEIEQILLFINGGYNFDKPIDICGICDGYNYNTQKRKYIKSATMPDLVYVKDNRLYLTINFVRLYFAEIEKFEKATELTEDEQEDEYNGIVYLTPKSRYNQFLRSLEGSDVGTIKDRIHIKNPKGFYKPKNIHQIQTDMSRVVKLKINIIEKLPVKNQGIPIKYQYETEDLMYQVFSSEIDMFRANQKIGPTIDGIRMNNEDDFLKIPLANLKKSKHLVSKIPSYYYKGQILFEDGPSEDIIFESIHPLETVIIDAYGFVRTGSENKSLYMVLFGYVENKSFQIINSLYPKINEKDLNKHEFYKLQEFLFKYIRSKGFAIKKAKSDTFIWMEVLKTIVQFGGYDKDKTVHSLYSGLQDGGKSYVVDVFIAIKFANWCRVTPTQMSGPGLFGSSNQSIVLPNDTIKGVPRDGAFAKEAVFCEEIGHAIIDPKQIFTTDLATFKNGLFSTFTEDAKVGGGKHPRNGYATMTMNYDKTWVKNIRKQLLKKLQDVEAAFEKDPSYVKKSGEIEFDEDTEDDTGKSTVLLQSLIEKEDVFREITDFNYPFKSTEGKTIDKINTLLFQQTLINFKNEMITDQRDERTGLDNSFMKRLLFSVFGTMQEVDKKLKTIDDLDVSDLSLERKSTEELRNSLYLASLSDFIKGRIEANERELLGSDTLTKFNRLFDSYRALIYLIFVTKYQDFTQKTGDSTIEDQFKIVYRTLLYFNKEKVPSLQSLQILEKWLYLQVTPIEAAIAKSDIRFEHKMKDIYEFNKENYTNKMAELKNEIVKMYKKRGFKW